MEWFNNNASAVIAAASALLAAIIAAVSTIVTIHFNNEFNRLTRLEQITFDKWKINRDFYIIKGDELFNLFNLWYEIIHQIHLDQLSSLIFTKIKNETDMSTPSFKDVYSKINAINTMFFPELSDDFKKLNSRSGKMFIAFSQEITGDINKNDAIIIFQREMEFLRMDANDFRDKIAEKVNRHL